MNNMYEVVLYKSADLDDSDPPIYLRDACGVIPPVDGRKLTHTFLLEVEQERVSRVESALARDGTIKSWRRLNPPESDSM